MALQKRTGVKTFATAIATAALLFAATACQKEKAREAAFQTVRAGTVEEIRPDRPERYAAAIVPSEEVSLAFKSPGLIERIQQIRGADGRTRNVQAGDKVSRGTELAVVRRLDYEQQVQQAHEQVRQAEAQLAQAEAGFQQAEQDYTRASNLYRTASLIKPDYDQAKARYDSAKAQVEGVKATIANARVSVSTADLSLGDTVLKAPISGWITARNVEVGSLVGNTTVGFTMIESRVVKASFAVPDTTLKSTRTGQRLTVSLDALQHPVTGVVTAISPQADPKTRVFSVEVSIDNARDEIRPGMIGTLVLGPARESAPRLVVPLSAIVRAPNAPNMFAIYRLDTRDGKTFAVSRPVTLGNTFGNSIEVTEGVTAGERIVALGGELLRDGQEVRVLP